MTLRYLLILLLTNDGRATATTPGAAAHTIFAAKQQTTELQPPQPCKQHGYLTESYAILATQSEQKSHT